MCIYKLESIIYTKLIENDIGVEEDIFLIIFGLVKPVFVFCTSYFILRNHVGGIHVANPLLIIIYFNYNFYNYSNPLDSCK